MRIFPFLCALLILFGLVSCGGGSGGSGNTQREEEPTGGESNGPFKVTTDSELTPAEKSAFNRSVVLLESMQIDGSDVPGFTEIFAGPHSSNVVSYLNSRINYIISINTPYDSRYLVEDSGLVRFQDFYGFNPSSFIWYTALIHERETGTKVFYEINGLPQNIDSARVGVIQLGNIFAGPQSDDITNAITLVHEARHSDCPGGAWASDLQKFNAGLEWANAKCGQLHLGLDGGDTIPWGPYAIDYIYSKAIELTCSSCTPLEKKQAQANALDVQSRAFDILGTVKGQYGPPDMSDSAQVREDL